MEILIFFALHWYLSLFCQTFFHHRYSAHGMFTMSKGWEKMFFYLSFITQGSSYLSPYAYGIMHRLHHAHADTEEDPHSPKYDRNVFTMMWRSKMVYTNIFNGKIKVEEKYKKGVPEMHGFDHFADRWVTRAFWAVAYGLFYFYFAEHWAWYLLFPIQLIMGPFHGAIINWAAHKYGYTNFDVSDTSKNLWPVDLLMLGEGLHNNHHKNSGSPNFGFKWFEFDPIYPFIRLFNLLGIIQLRKNLAG